MNSDVITSYTRMKRAIELANKSGYDVEVYSECIKLKPKSAKVRSPYFHFFTPEEIIAYLNGVDDGKFMAVMEQKEKEKKKKKKK